eukprot:CAMPEP_0177478166 /NCGR_PEP_ID=MMETSP0369-20130122/24535_1 /TAXON_ID=447022 ORGANISM="Scrippsiella hangoei-like, Strain SHHI-4" /NCGR_SAMPLE_ID=MMETSP0369 /ASSEMBLY_ACC=CAM_ASM_000364 /LENGTH=139 /DNA_ID=CAMNT_0018953565 /DNA_START=43 /DNA_END=463 /DNA_ORIENTATION=+
MAARACLVIALLLPTQALAGWFGPPKYVKDACDKWCRAASSHLDATEACLACEKGPQTNPECSDDVPCDYCKAQITFPRHYPKLWKDEPTFDGKMEKLEGSTSAGVTLGARCSTSSLGCGVLASAQTSVQRGPLSYDEV